MQFLLNIQLFTEEDVASGKGTVCCTKLSIKSNKEPCSRLPKAYQTHTVAQLIERTPDLLTIPLKWSF